MIKNKLLLIPIFCALQAHAQINVNESFTSTTFPPSGWSTKTETSSSGFTRTTSSSYYCSGSAAARKELYGSGASSSSFMMYSTNASNGGEITFSFNYLAKQPSTLYVVEGNLKVEYSIDSGNTWITVGSQIDFTTSSTACSVFTGTIPQGAVPSNSDFKLRITGTKTDPSAGTSDWYLSIDDVVITQSANLNVQEQIKTENTIIIYPNPFTNGINLSNGEKIKSLFIYDSLGKLIKTIHQPSKQISLEYLSAGTYFVVAKMNNETEQKVKIIKN